MYFSGGKDRGEGCGGSRRRNRNGGEGIDRIPSLPPRNRTSPNAHIPRGVDETHLASRYGDPLRVHRHHRAEHRLAQEWGHEYRPHGRRGGHQDAQGHVSLGYVGAEVARLSAVDAPHEDHPRQQAGVEPERPPERHGEAGHHAVAQRELHEYRARFARHGREVGGGEGDPHGQHEGREGGREVLGREEVEGRRAPEGDGGEQHRPQGEEGRGGVRGLGVRVEYFGGQGFAVLRGGGGGVGALVAFSGREDEGDQKTDDPRGEEMSGDVHSYRMPFQVQREEAAEGGLTIRMADEDDSIDLPPPNLPGDGRWEPKTAFPTL
jgi:hypothetical protein